MPSAVYQPKPWGGVPLAAIFRHLTKVAGVSRYAARTMMTDMLEREPPPWLPSSWRLILTADGGIALRTPDRDIPGERILMRYRRLGESSHHQPDEGLQKTPADAPPAPASEASAEIVSKEEHAIEWLSGLLYVGHLRQAGQVHAVASAPPAGLLGCWRRRKKIA